MSTPQSFERVILKVLKGVQSGAEVSLIPGEYIVGTGENDDIHLTDVSVQPGHARLRIGNGTIEVAGGSGSAILESGETLEPQSAFQEIEPLDVIEVGMVRFVLGPVNANWTTLTEEPGDAEKKPPKKKSETSRPKRAAILAEQGSRLSSMLLPVLLLCAFAGGAIWYLSGPERQEQDRRMTFAEMQTLARATLDQFPFGKPVALRAEADGTLYAEGFVQDTFERRALLQSAEQEGLQINFRLGVINSLVSEIEGLIRAENMPITFDLSPQGELTLKGVILDDAEAQSLVEQVRVGVIGLSGITSEIQTAETILADIQEISRLTEIDPYVLFRLDGDLIEANGILPTNLIDGWEGFLQAFVRRHSEHIGLRSYVQLQAADGTLQSASTNADVRPIIIGGPGASGGNSALANRLSARANGDIVLDSQRLAQGEYQASDFFAKTADVANATSSEGAEAGASEAGNETASSAPLSPSSILTDITPLTALTPFKADKLAGSGNDLITQWMNGDAPKLTTEDLDKLAEARHRLRLLGQGDVINSPNLQTQSQEGQRLQLLNLVDRANREKVSEEYFPIFSPRPARQIADACRLGSRLTPENLPVALFWLDIMSLSESLSLGDLTQEEQAFILEAALDPRLVKACLVQNESTPHLHSVYLYETERNPEFVNFLTRYFEKYPMDVSGASLIKSRYIQMRNGEKLDEGGAPDNSSRLIIVGELGAAVQRKEGFWTVIYDPSLNWLSEE